MKEGNYEFQPSMLTKAHQKCQGDTFTALQKGKVVVVANTNVETSHIRMYEAYRTKFLLIKFQPVNVSAAISRGIGNDKNIPTKVFNDIYNKIINLKINRQDFTLLESVITVLV